MQLDFDLRSGPVKTRSPAKAEEPEILSVSALTRKVRGLLEGNIGSVWVEGEVSNLRRQSSGHIYFTLKDAASQLACVLFAGQTPQLRGMNFADGMQVQIFGELTVYEARGNYQIIVRRVQERGAGALQAKFEELKRRLDAEGLFKQEKKRPLPKFPRRIGVVTSPTGAAVRDFLNVLHRRQRGIEVLIFPVRVQGKGAASEIAEAVRLLGKTESLGIAPVDVIVVTRGGGSLEDLWEFNEEAVARAIAGSPVPVVSAIGHEIDFTISDFAADVRAATPSAAAEILSADSSEIAEKLQHLEVRLRRPVQSRIQSVKTFLENLGRTALFFEPQRVLRDHSQTLDRFLDDLETNAAGGIQNQTLILERFTRTILARSPERKIADMTNALEQRRSAMNRICSERQKETQATLSQNAALIKALNPNAALARGYTLTLDQEGHLIRSASQIHNGQTISTRFHDGSAESKVLAAQVNSHPTA